jgi:hypothetical protein
VFIVLRIGSKWGNRVHSIEQRQPDAAPNRGWAIRRSEGALAVPEIELDADLLAALDGVFPGAGSPGTGADPAAQSATAPWAYSW